MNTCANCVMRTSICFVWQNAASIQDFGDDSFQCISFSSSVCFHIMHGLNFCTVSLQFLRMGKRKTNQRMHQKQTSEGQKSVRSKPAKHNREHKFEKFSQELCESLPGKVGVLVFIFFCNLNSMEFARKTLQLCLLW